MQTVVRYFLHARPRERSQQLWGQPVRLDHIGLAGITFTELSDLLAKLRRAIDSELYGQFVCTPNIRAIQIDTKSKRKVRHQITE